MMLPTQSQNQRTTASRGPSPTTTSNTAAFLTNRIVASPVIPTAANQLPIRAVAMVPTPTIKAPVASPQPWPSTPPASLTALPS